MPTGKPERNWRWIFLSHYTAPWVVVALLEAGVDAHNAKIVLATESVLEAHRHGIWPCHEFSEPIWATFDCLQAISHYALRSVTLR
jgi:hypothetical protein